VRSAFERQIMVRTDRRFAFARRHLLDFDRRPEYPFFIKRGLDTELLSSDEPLAYFVTLTQMLGASGDDAEVRAAREAVIVAPRI